MTLQTNNYIKKRGEWGWIIQVTFTEGGTAIDISSATSKKIAYRLDSTTVVRDASFLTDGTDGIIQYATTVDAFTDVGRYDIEGSVTLISGRILTIETFRVNIVESIIVSVES